MYILHTMNSRIDPQELRAAYQRYNEYLESLRDKLPAAAFSFATAPWHYNPQDPRCPHDAWLEQLTVEELAPDPNEVQQRHVEIHVRLLGAYHDGHIELVYKRVQNYTLTKHMHKWMSGINQGHHDWLIDEIRLSDQGFVLHEVMFDGAHWLIECEDVAYTWLPFQQGKAPH